MKNLLLILILALFVASCQKDEEIIGDDLLGNWVYISQDENADDTRLLKRTKKLDVNNPSIGFYENDFLIDNANAGFCGTPPITYAKYEGNWEMSENIVDYKCAFWGGQKIIKFEIISVDNDFLKIKVLKVDYVYDR